RMAPKWAGEDPGGTLFVLDLMAATPAATAALWRFCLDVDLMTRLEAVSRSSEDPVRHLLADARAARSNVYDGLWLRLVDVAAAGRVEAREPGAVLRADTLFASSPAPWCTTHF